MAIRVYEYSKCSTCRKALKFLEARGIAHTAVPIVDSPPSVAELKTMLGHVGLKRLFNTSGVQYRELGISEKLKTMSEAEALALLSKNGKLIKRPFLLLKDRGLVGFQEAEWKAAFK
ncbi:MAG: arsenate reductase family protein [Elusimicrobiota bacterium]|nr:MAG: arsenate reductase family protein [Elusimicrobiota bacterium]